VLLADALRTMGYTMSTLAGISICIDDMVIPPSKIKLLESAKTEVTEIEEQYTEGLITDGERYNKVVDIWAQAAEAISKDMMRDISTQEFVDPEGKVGDKKAPSFNSIFVMADSGARGSQQQMRQLAGMRGLMAKPSGEIIETPITTNFREGLTVHQYFISTHGARKGLADTALKTANSGYLTRRLVDVSQDNIVSEFDCGTRQGMEMMPLIEGGEIIERLGDRILGRVAMEDIVDPYTGEVLVPNNSEINEDHVKIIENSGIDRVKIRSVLSCETRRGICTLCYGRDLARGQMVNIGEAVGVIAAQSIGEPGTQLTMRTFHIGGVATGRTQQSSLEARNDGTIRLNTVQVVKRKDYWVVMNRQGEVVLTDELGRERRGAGRGGRAPGAAVRGQAGRGGGRQGQGRSAPVRVGPVHHADRHGSGGPRGLRRHRRRRDDAGVDRRGHRDVAQDHHRVQGRGQPPPHRAARRGRRVGQDPRLRQRGEVLPAGGRQPVRQRR